MTIVKYRLARRSQSKSEVGPYEDIEFLATDDSGQEMVLFARMESDDLFIYETLDQELNTEFKKFLDDNYDLLHYYMDPN